MKILDYLYFKVYSFYEKKFKSDINGVYAVSVLVLFVFLHFVLYDKFIDYFNLETDYSLNLNRLKIIIIFLILYVILGIRYGIMLSHNKLKEKKFFSNLKQVNKLIIIYCTIFILALVLLLLG